MRLLFSSWGSRGDLHPFLSLGQGLIRRGHHVSMVGPEAWREETESSGLRFCPTAEIPFSTLFAKDLAVFSSRLGGLSSLKALVQKGLVPSFQPILDVLLQEASTHDAIVAHPFSYAAPVAAQLTGKPWVTVTLAPSMSPSAYTYPAPQFKKPGADWMSRQIQRTVWAVGQRLTAPLVDPGINDFRLRHGLKPGRNFFFAGHSPLLNLHLYSRHFAPLPSDWTPEKKQGGFCYLDPATPDELPQEITHFLAQGPAPVLVTLGSAVTLQAGNFFNEISQALDRLGLRGLFLYGEEANRPPWSATQRAVSYLPFGRILPWVSAAVHQGGIGTLAQTLRAGVPSLICPFAFDQPSNGLRAEALGVARVVRPSQRKAVDLTRLLNQLLHSTASQEARKLRYDLEREDGVALSCEVLERTL